MYDVAIVGGGPAGASCAAFCAAAGKRVVLLEREKFPREKVCGDCLNPSCWPVLHRLGVEAPVREAAHGKLDAVTFITRRGREISVALPRDAEIAIKRSLFDLILLEHARAAGAEVQEDTTVTSVSRDADTWNLGTANENFRARFLVAADGRNSTIARMLHLLPRVAKERVALQAHVPLPQNFGRRVILQWLDGGYSGQAPVNDCELNLCLVGRAHSIDGLKNWAAEKFSLAPSQTWRTITPLTRPPVAPVHPNLLLIGDAARVVEPLTGEGIFYALRSGELAASTISKGTDFARAHATMYYGRGWVNALSRLAVTSPKLGSRALELARLQPSLLRFLTAKIAGSADTP